MSSGVTESVVQMGKLLVHIAENGHSIELQCDEHTLVANVQRFLESETGIQLNDQLLLCLYMKMEPQHPLSIYRLPSNDQVFLFNKARMRSNSSPPAPEKAEIIDVPVPPLLPSYHSPHLLDDASDPAVKALLSYERQFGYHFRCGHAIYSCTLAKMSICERLFREQKVQQRTLEIAGCSLDHVYSVILQTYREFEKFYSQQHKRHTNLLVNFRKDVEKLRYCKILPVLQTSNRKCLLDFVKEEDLQRIVEDCSSSHRQFENKVAKFKLEFGELRLNVEHLFSRKAAFLIGEQDSKIKDHQQYINEQKSIMQTLSKDVNNVKKIVYDCLTSQVSSSIRPHDAVSALGPMYLSHNKSCIPKMQACDRAISHLLEFCLDKKNEMNIFVHNYMQKIAYIQFTIKDVWYKFSVFQEAFKHQKDQFEHLRVVHGIGPAYRACLAEVVRRKEAMKLYVGMAGQLAERLAAKREAEVRRREEFLKAHSLYMPRDILMSMGLYDTPHPCDVHITPFDTHLPDINISDVNRYAPEHLVGFFISEKHEISKGSYFMSNDGPQSVEVDGGAVDFPEKFHAMEFPEGSELVEIAGTSKMEVENTKLKAELAFNIALICSIGAKFDYESLDDSKVESVLKSAAEKTNEALHLKDEYEKHLHHMLKIRQIQCQSYKKRIHELEQELFDQCLLGHELKVDEDASKVTLSTIRTDDSKSEIFVVGESHGNHPPHEVMDEVSCASSSTNITLGVLPEQVKAQEGLDDMTGSSNLLNLHLDSSMTDQHRDEGQLCDKDGKDTLANEGVATGMPVSMSQPSDALHSETVTDQCLDFKASSYFAQLQSELEEKSKILREAEGKMKALTDEIINLGRKLEISQKLLDESQMNCARLENCLHEAREEAQAHLCAADRSATEYSALRASAVKMQSLFKRLRTSVLSNGGFPESLRALAQSLANSISENEDDGTAGFCECIRVVADKVGILSGHRVELLERYSKAEAAYEQHKRALEEKKELVNTLYIRHQLEKQANKEKISFGRLEVHEIAAFIPNSAGHYEAINRNCSHYYLSAESVALFVDHIPNRPPYIVGQIVHIERQTAKAPSAAVERDGDRVDVLPSDSGPTCLTLNSGSASNPYGLPPGCEYFIVTVAMLPDTIICSLLPDLANGKI